MKYCEKCGEHLDDDAVFCGKCGHKVGKKSNEAVNTNDIESKNTSNTISTNSGLDKSPKKKSPLIPILCGIIGVLVVAIIIMVVVINKKTDDSSKGKNEQMTITSSKSIEETSVSNNTIQETSASSKTEEVKTTEAITASSKTEEVKTTEATTVSKSVMTKNAILGSWTSYTGNDSVMEYSSKYMLVFNGDGTVSCKGYKNNHSGEYEVDSDGTIVCSFTKCIDSFPPMGPTEIQGYTAKFVLNPDGTLISPTGSNGTTNWGKNTVWTKVE